MYSAVFLSYDIVWWNSTVCLRGHKLVACGNTISYTIFGKNNGYKKLDIWPDAVPSIFDFGPTASKSNTGKSSKTSTALFKPMGTGWGSMGRGKWIKFDKKKITTAEQWQGRGDSSERSGPWASWFYVLFVCKDNLFFSYIYSLHTRSFILLLCVFAKRSVD